MTPRPVNEVAPERPERPDTSGDRPSSDTALFLSLAAPGLGHVYLGQVWRGLLLTSVYVAVLLLTILGAAPLWLGLPAVIATAFAIVASAWRIASATTGPDRSSDRVM